MFAHEKEALERVAARLRARFADRVAALYAFGSRVRGDHDAWSDFDVLVVVRGKTPELELEIVGLFTDEELESGVLFSPVIKDESVFDRERHFSTSFYRNVMSEGVRI